MPWNALIQRKSLVPTPFHHTACLRATQRFERHTRLRFELLEHRLVLSTLPAGFTETLVTTQSDLSAPTAMEFSPTGELWVLEQAGRVKLVRNDGITHTALSVSVDSVGERGMLGIAFDPSYDGVGSNPDYVYLYYTNPQTGATDPANNRLSRFTVVGAGTTTATLTSEVVLRDLPPEDEDNNPATDGNTNHNGGAIHFGPDGKLYVAVGDHNYDTTPQSSHVSQILTTPFGKILRLNSDGSNPSDNPFYNGSATDWQGSIWALGLRNPYTFAFEPGTGTMFINDVGEGVWEEINRGEARANYGWAGSTAPLWEGFESPPPAWEDYRDPVMAYDHSNSPPSPFGCAITGGAFYPAGGPFGSDYAGKYFFADFCGNFIRLFDPANPGSLSVPDTSIPFAANLTTANPVDLKVDSAGNLYYLARGGPGEIYRISFQAGDELGAVDYRMLDRLNLGQGNLYFNLSTVNSGTLTLEVVAPDPAGSAAVRLYDQDPVANPGLTPLVTSTLVDGNQRADLQVGGGETYYVELFGSNVDFDLRIANLVRHDGTTVTIHGTAADDEFLFDASGGHGIAIRGVSYSFTASEATTFAFDGAGGRDDVRFIGTDGSDSATLRPTQGTMVGGSYTLEAAHVESFDYDGGAGDDAVVVWGSQGTETYKADPGVAEMSGNGVSIRVTAENIFARGAGGGDTVVFGDSAGDDVLEYFSWWARMRGDGYLHHVRGFKTMKAEAELGQNGTDRVVVRGSAHNDYLRVNPYNAALETSVVRFLSGSGSVWHIAHGFDTIIGFGRGGALIDQLFLNDTPGADTFDVRRLQANLDAPDYAVTVTAHGFGTVEVRRANANEKADEIGLGDSPQPDHNDTLVGDPERVTLSGPGYVNKALNFPSVRAYSSAGYDTAHFSDLTDPNDSRTGVDTFTARPVFSRLDGSGYKLWARLFDEVHVESNYGLDIANLYGNANGAELTGTAAEVRLSGTHSAGAYANHARSFHEVNAVARVGPDRAVLTDAVVDPATYGPPQGTPLEELAQILWLDQFETVELLSSNSDETTEINDVDRIFAFWE